MRNQIGSSLHRHPRRVLAGAVGVLVVGMLVFAGGSLGAEQNGPPRFLKEVGNKTEFFYKEEFSTRVRMYVKVAPEELATKWTASYREHEHEGEPWIAANGGEITQGLGDGTFTDFTFLDLGAEDVGPESRHEGIFLRGLKPGTSYEARFTAENADDQGKPVEEVVPFETLPVAKPEVDQLYLIEPAGTSFKIASTGFPTDTTAGFEAKIDANGSDSTYHFEYSTVENGPSGSWHEFTSGATGTVGAGEEYKTVQAGLSGLKPETTYFVRLRASNSVPGETIQSEYSGGKSFTTGSAKPSVESPSVRNVVADSAFVNTVVNPRGSESTWGLEYSSESGVAGSWIPVPGGSGTVSQAEATATPYSNEVLPSGVRLLGLKASTTYFVRATASNAGAGCEGCGGVTSAPVSFMTEGAPSASVYVAHGVHGESLRLLGSVDPNSVPTTSEQVVTVEGATGGSFKLDLGGGETVGLPFDASVGEVDEALRQVDPFVEVEGAAGGPYTVAFVSEEAGKAQPLIVGDGSALTGGTDAKVGVVSSFVGGVSYEAHYRFQYVSEKGFAEHGWGGAAESAEANAGSGGAARDVGADLPVLSEGETYRYRLLVQSSAPGTGLVASGEGSLTVPVAPVAAGGGGCANEAFRTGSSAGLPDCRAYEQLTPVEKEGAQEPFHYGGLNIGNYGLAAEAGGRFVFEALGTDYFPGPNGGGGPYLFSREEGQGWSILTGDAQPEAGVEVYEPQVYSANLTQVALAATVSTSEATTSAGEVQYKVGPVGGPYALVKAIPEKLVGAASEPQGWVAGDSSMSKLVFATIDHELLGAATGTKSGLDLYEYTAAGGLAQLNVSGESASTIGSCGAKIVQGLEDGDLEQIGREKASGPHSLSSDGSRVFFEADPGKRCGEEPSHLYMRVDGTETVDLGARSFRAANAEGSELLLESETGTHEASLYDTEKKLPTPLPGLENLPLGQEEDVVVASDLSAVYSFERGALYRYDIDAGKAERLFGVAHGAELTVTADGRYVYFHGAVGGLPGGAAISSEKPSRGEPGPGAGTSEEALQLYRYDSQEGVVQCISCASHYDPRPREPAFLYDSGSAHPEINGGLPLDVSVSGNGEFAFFTTPAALVKEDIDGEIGIEQAVCSHRSGGGLENCEYGDTGAQTSPSSDIYEWREEGVNGCAQLEGCVALISGGRGGYKTLLLGSADEGNDVYIYTREQLGPRDVDTAADVYDVRVGGTPAGPVVRPTECEANSCSVVPGSPVDLTPASFSFAGVGNVSPVAPAGKPVVKKKAPPKKKHEARKKRKARKGRGSRAKKGAARKTGRGERHQA
jgi:hypothetical protein